MSARHGEIPRCEPEAQGSVRVHQTLAAEQAIGEAEQILAAGLLEFLEPDWEVTRQARAPDLYPLRPE